VEFLGRGAVTSGADEDAADAASEEGIDSTAEVGVSVCGWRLLEGSSIETCKVEVAKAVPDSVPACA
jgi:hypothetical protein